MSVSRRNYYVGRRFGNQPAYVRFDAETRDWLFELTSKLVIRWQPADLSLEAILKRRVIIRHRGKRGVASRGKR